VARTTAGPRELESGLLVKSAASLQRIRDDWENGGREGLKAALLFNRRLWTVFLTSVTRDDSPLPRDIRQNVANLGLFIMNHTLAIEAEPAREKLDVLININREIATGLRARSSAAA